METNSNIKRRRELVAISSIGEQDSSKVKGISQLTINSIKIECVETVPGQFTNVISGPIKCDKGFKVTFNLRSPYSNSNNWRFTQVYLVEHSRALSKWIIGTGKLD